ncbi:hypothetical protein J3R82DRAFT_6117 [Butyriboletus roseoflavus]|nr:hypothetical protein J3R82DRAFT_6117 [Butyriboletus roseoflavus]
MTLTASSAVESHLHERVPDTASELLIAELVLNDIAAVQATRKGKAREDAPRSDEDIAFDFQAASLNTLIGVLQDHQFASSIDRAIETDAHQLGRIALQEQAERDDHRAAVALGNGHDLPQQTLLQRRMELTTVQYAREPAPVPRGNISNATEVDTKAIRVGVENLHITTPVAPVIAPHQHSQSLDTGLECVICGDDVLARRSFEAPCAHRYCRGCIVSLVETSLRDESLHPLRCCHQPLPLELGVFRFISISLRSQFLTKRREYSIPAGSRVYCSNPGCSTFLDASGDIEERSHLQ